MTHVEVSELDNLNGNEGSVQNLNENLNGLFTFSKHSKKVNLMSAVQQPVHDGIQVLITHSSINEYTSRLRSSCLITSCLNCLLFSFE